MKLRILWWLAILAVCTGEYARADSKISALPAGTAIAGTESIPAVQSGATVRTTPAAINTYVQAQTPTVTVARGGTGAVTLTGPLKGNGTSAVSAALAADIYGLWSGTCNASTFLRGDGACAATNAGTVTSVALTSITGITVTGSPVTSSGTLALSTVLNGPLRGDGTGFATGATVLTSEVSGTLPVTNGGTGLAAVLQGDMVYSAADNALSRLAKNTNATRYLSNQGTSNAPSWSSVNLSNGVTGDLAGTTRSSNNYALVGSWTWNTSAAPIIINTTAPRVEYIENDAGTDLTFWDHIINGAVQSFRTRTDADGTGKTWLSVTRGTTTAIASIAIGNAADSPPVTINGTTILLPLSATTASIAPGALAAGACGSGTVAVTNSTTSMAVIASPNTYPGDAVYTKAQVTSNGTVTVKVCVSIAATPTGSTYNVRVIQ